MHLSTVVLRCLNVFKVHFDPQKEDPHESLAWEPHREALIWNLSKDQINIMLSEINASLSFPSRLSA